VNSSSVSHCGRFANSLLDLRRSARLILCIGGVLLLAGSPGWVSATPRPTPPFPYFYTCWLYLLTRRLFAGLLRKITALPVPTG
ncbi:MAG TPA: hypothetical protein VII23_24075, partial [Terriglobales bacterium]